MSEEPIVPIPSEEPRCCPACGTRVAKQAKTCLICGADLTEEPKEEVKEPTPRPVRRRWVFWLVAVLLSLAILTIAGLLLQPFIFPAEPTVTPTISFTPTTVAVITNPPAHTPTATPTPTPVPPRAHQVQEGETVASIAQQYETTVEEILTLNPGITPELLQVGQVLLIPPAILTPTPEVSGEDVTPTMTGDFIVHVVAPGETLITIAQQYSVTVALIRAANPGIPPGSDVIQVNQSIVIPLGTPMPTVIPTSDPNATPTPLPIYSSPLLLNPPDGGVFGPDEVIVLQWASVGILRATEWYEVHVARSGAEPVVVRTRATAYRVPAALYPPSGSLAREFRWHVRVVRRASGGTFELASEPESVRVFMWMEELPTPTVSPTP